MTGPGELDIDIFQGANFALAFTVYGDDGEVLSIAGATIRGRVKNDINDLSAAAIFTFVGTVTDGPNGEGTLTLTAATTAAWVPPALAPKKRTPSKYLWDAEVVFSDGYVQRLLQGFAFVHPEVCTA
jgi:hypothetical protein